MNFRKVKLLLFLRHSMLILGISVFVFSCRINKFIPDGKYLIKAHRVKAFEEDVEKGKKKSRVNIWELEMLGKPQKNNRLKLWVFIMQQTKDSMRLNNKLEKRISEPPAYLDENLVKRSAKSMENYLYNEGFFNAEVDYEVKKKKKKAKVFYRIDAKKRYFVNTLEYTTQDSILSKRLPEFIGSTYLKPGVPLSVANYNKEVNRVVNTLQNEGYAFFYPKYFDQVVTDSTGTRDLDVTINILSPPEKKVHKKYHIGKVWVRFNKGDAIVTDTLIDGIHFSSSKTEFPLDPMVVRKQILLNEGDLFMKSKVDNSIIQLSRIDFFKYVNVEFERIDNVNHIIDITFDITTNKRFDIGGSIDLQYSHNSGQQLNLMGFKPSLSYSDKNFNRRGILFDITPDALIEYAIGNKKLVINQLNYSLNSNLYVNKFVPVFNIFKQLAKRNIGGLNPIYQEFLTKSKTKFSLSFQKDFFVNTFYNTSISANFGYKIKRKRQYLNWSQISLQYLDVELGDSLKVLVEDKEYLEKSFQDYLFTGLLYSNMSYGWTNKTRTYGNSWNIKLNHELSGFEALLIEKGFELAGANLGVGKLKFAQYSKFDFNIVRNSIFNDKHALAIRFFGGIVVPLSKKSSIIPWVKQFEVGGPNSVRAWRYRNLGPGIYEEKNRDNPPYFQKGDIRMEMNVEYRFDIWGYFEGALFVDMGNIWSLEPVKDRPGSEISPDFYKQFAVGPGLGLRFNVNFFIVRLDVGYKWRHPAIQENGSNWDLNLKEPNYNFGFSYPF